MANTYVGTGGDDFALNVGTTWALRYATLGGNDGAHNFDSAGDTIFVAKTHNESISVTSATLNFAGTISNPVRIICVDEATGEPPTTPSTGAVVTHVSASGTIFRISGHIYMYGMTLVVGNTTQNDVLFFGGLSARESQVYEKCTFKTGSTGATAGFAVSASGNAANNVKLKNCDFRFSAVQQTISLFPTDYLWEGGSILAGGVSPTSIFTSTSTQAVALITGVDFSNCASTVNMLSTNSLGRITFRNCKLPTGWSGALYSGTMPCGGRFEMHNCDAGSTNYRVWIKDFTAELREETTLVKSAGASDGTTSFSWKVTTSANCNALSGRFSSPEVAKWNSVAGTPITVSMDILHDSAVNLKDDQVWLEVVYLGDTGTPLASFASDFKANILSVAADQSASAAVWTTTGLAAPNKQTLSVTFTPQKVGFIQAKVVLGKPSYVVYVDPKLQVS